MEDEFCINCKIVPVLGGYELQQVLKWSGHEVRLEITKTTKEELDEFKELLGIPTQEWIVDNVDFVKTEEVEE